MASCFISPRLNPRSLAADRGGAQGNLAVRKERITKGYSCYIPNYFKKRVSPLEKEIGIKGKDGNDESKQPFPLDGNEVTDCTKNSG
jgi:hypothetical protein